MQIETKLSQVAHSTNGDYVANFPDYGRDEEENANESADFEAVQATTEALESRLEEVKAALDRINQGNYGVTRGGEVIPEERLRANPAATTIVKHT